MQRLIFRTRQYWHRVRPRTILPRLEPTPDLSVDIVPRTANYGPSPGSPARDRYMWARPVNILGRILHEETIWIDISRQVRHVRNRPSQLLRVADAHWHGIIESVVIQIHLSKGERLTRSKFERATSRVPD